MYPIFLFFSRIQQKYNSFSGSVRLAKRWISSQLLAEHVPDLSVELMVAYLYTCHAPYTTPRYVFYNHIYVGLQLL